MIAHKHEWKTHDIGYTLAHHSATARPMMDRKMHFLATVAVFLALAASTAQAGCWKAQDPKGMAHFDEGGD